MSVMNVASYLSAFNVTRNEPRIEEHYPVVFSTFEHVALFVGAYFLILTMGPRMMADRKPFDLKGVIMVYNVLQVLANLYLIYATFDFWGFGILRVWNHVCNPFGDTVGFDQQTQFKFFRIMFLYYLTKIFDLMDTVFFILRKKQSQVTFLHVFHHSWMVVSMWITTVFLREQIAGLFGYLNMVVHVFMYGYYFLSAFGPGVQKYLWWKKHLTKMQLLQFVIIISVLMKVKVLDCSYSPLYWWLWFSTISLFLALFLHFYARSYMRKEKLK